MRLAILLVWLLSPMAAFSAPAVAAVAAWVSTNVVLTQVLLTIAMAAYGNARRRRAERAAKDAYNNSLADRTITSVATDSPYVYVYGRARVGSAVRAIFTSGDKDQYKHLVCVHAAHECDAIEEIYIAGKALGTLDADGLVTSGDYYKLATHAVEHEMTTNTYTVDQTGIVADSVGVVYEDSNNGGGGQVEFTYSGGVVTVDPELFTSLSTSAKVYVKWYYTTNASRVRVKKHLGTAGDPVDSYLHGLLPTKWPTTATLDGFCYTVITLDLNQPEFQSGIPAIEVLLRGKKVYDPRTDTTVWSQNPALIINDYLTSEMCGVDSSDIPQDYLISAANDCDEVVAMAEIDSNGSYVSGARYTFNGTVTSEQNQQEVLNQMADSMGGGITSTSWKMWAGVYTAPVLSLTQDDIVGSISITPGVSDADLFNGVKGQYANGLNNYVTSDYKPYQNSTYVTGDGRELWHNLDFPYTDNVQRVWNLCRIFTEDQRNSYTVTAEFSMKAWDINVGDRVYLTSDLFGWSNKVFRVVDKKFSPSSPVELSLKEDASSIWDFVDAAELDETPNTDLPNPFDVEELTSLTCSSGDDDLLLQADGTVVSRIKVEWPEATTQAVFTNGLIEVEWLRTGESVWNKVVVSGNETGAYLSPAHDGSFYTIRARAVNPYFNVKSDWIYTLHQVVGKSANPPDVTGFAVSVLSDATRHFSWTVSDQPVDVLHGGGYIIKYRTAGSGTPFASMTPLHTGLLTQSPYDTRSPAAGTYDFAIAALDSSGNESASAALVSSVVITDTSTASTALAAANAAQADATSALSQLSDIANDNLLVPSEKTSVIGNYSVITGEQAGIDAQATAYGITTEKTAYDSAVSTLTTYLGTLTSPVAWNNTSGNTTIVGSTFRTNFANVYTTRQALLNAIYAAAKTLANNAQTTANTAVTNAAAAQTDATNALSQLSSITSDSILAKNEKIPVIKDVNSILNDFVKNRIQADAFGVSHTDYDNAVWALWDYLGTLSPSYDNIAADTTIDGGVFRQKFANVYTARQVMLNAIATKASTLATWTGVVSSSGKLSTAGDIFNGGAVGTTEIADEAATAVIVSNVSNVGVATGIGGGFTTIASITYTASVTGVVALIAKGGSSTNNYASPGTVVVETPLMKVVGTGGLASAVLVPSGSFQQTSSLPYNLDISMSTVFTLTSGNTYTFEFMMEAESTMYQCVVDNLEFRMEAIKK
jgi:hypothetical protein